MNSWKTYRLGDVCNLVAGFAFKSKDFGDYPNKVVKIADIQPPVVNTNDLVGVDMSNYDANKLRKYIVSKGDYVLAMTGATIGKLGRITDDIKAHINQRVLTFRPDGSRVDKDYLYYQLSSPLFSKYILNHIDSETAQPNISAGSVGGFEVSLPPLQEQRRIAGILGAIDDKIENNRRINTNLELQAQALYKQWFVDNRSDDWEEIKLGDIIEISKKSITPSQFENTIFEHYSLPAYDDGKQPTFDRGQDIKSSKFVINNGMFLFSKLNPYIKRIWFPNIGTEHAICSTEFIPYKPKRVDMLGLCYSIVNSEHFYDYVLSLTNGSTGSHQRFHPVDTLEYPLCIPSEKYIEKFESLVMPMYKEIALNRKENRRLATLRDTLLPKLMNGEIKL